MIPWRLIDKTTLAGGEEMSLHRRDDEFVIRVGRQELMTSRMHGSEDALGDLAGQAIRDRANPRMLIGGLGMGFTLAAALKALPTDAEVIVSELVPAVVEWNRGPLSSFSAGGLDDPRVELHFGDVAEQIVQANGDFNAIVLDVDNGPEGLTQDENDTLYTPAGLQAAHRALTKGGILAIWSVSQDAAFSRRVKNAGFSVTEVPVRAHGSRGRRHFIWLAKKK